MGTRPTGTLFAGANVLLEPGFRQRMALSWRLFRDPRVAPRLKLVAPVIAAVYLVSPIDLIPDLLLGLGQVDDLGVVALMLLAFTRLLPRLAPDDVLREHMAGMGMREAEGAARDEHEPEVVDAAYRVRR